MTRSKTWLAVALASAGLASAPSGARAQAMATSATGTGGGNMFSNAAMNPFLNPVMTQVQMTPNTAALYFLAAQQANGGIGSGQLSGSRPAPGGSSPSIEALIPQRATDVPGAGAARYFNRGSGPVARSSRYVNREGRHYGSR